MSLFNKINQILNGDNYKIKDAPKINKASTSSVEEQRRTKENLDSNNNQTVNNNDVQKKKQTVHPDVVKVLWIANGNQKNYHKDTFDKKSIAYSYAYLSYSDEYFRELDEPSLIYVDLPVNRSVTQAEFPSYNIHYKDMSPEQRGAYWHFLANPYEAMDKEHSPLHVFLCSVERHLIFGRHRPALDVLIRLMIQYKDDINLYQCSAAIMLACILHREKEVAISFFERISRGLPSWKTFPFSKDLFLLTKYELDIPVTASDIMHVAYAFDYKKRKYMQEQSERFEELIKEKIIEGFGKEEFLLSELVGKEDLEACEPWTTSSFLINESLATQTTIPYITKVESIHKCIRGIIDDVHRQMDAPTEKKRAIVAEDDEYVEIDENVVVDDGNQNVKMKQEGHVNSDSSFSGIQFVEWANTSAGDDEKTDHQTSNIESSVDNEDGSAAEDKMPMQNSLATLAPDSFSKEFGIMPEYYSNTPIPKEILSADTAAYFESLEVNTYRDLLIISPKDIDRKTAIFEARKMLRSLCETNDKIRLKDQYGIAEEELPKFDTNLLTNYDLSVRLYNVLERVNIPILYQILEHTPDELRSLRNMGKKSYNELLDKLRNAVSEHLNTGMSSAEMDAEAKRQFIQEGGEKAYNNIPATRRNTSIAGYIKAYTTDANLKKKLLEGNENKSIEEFYESLRAVEDEGYKIEAIKLLEWCSFDVKEELAGIEKTIYKNEREQKVLCDRADGRTLNEIGESLGITRERVRQIENKSRKRVTQFLDQHNILMKIYAERNQDEVLTPAELMEYFGDETSVCLYVLRSEESQYYRYDSNLDVFIIDNDALADKVVSYVESLEETLSLREYNDAIDRGRDEFNLNVELLAKAMRDSYSRSGNVYHRKRLTKKKLYESTVIEHYPNGLHIYDDEVMQEFRDHIIDDFGEVDLPENNRAIAARLADICILCGRGIYKPKQEEYISDQLLLEIRDYIEKQEASIIPISSIDHVFKRRLRDEGVDNKYYLQGILHELLGNVYSFRRDYIVTDDVDTPFYMEMIEYIKSSDSPVSKEQLRRKYPGVTDIVLNLATSDKNILNYFGSYWHSSHVSVSDDEKQLLASFIDDFLGHRQDVNSRELYDTISRRMESTLTRNKVFSQYSLFSLLNYLFENDYSFERPYIGRKNVDISRITFDDEIEQIYREEQYPTFIDFCSNNEIGTIGELIDGNYISDLQEYGVNEQEIKSIESSLADIVSVNSGQLLFNEIDDTTAILDIGVLTEFGVHQAVIEQLNKNGIEKLGQLKCIEDKVLTSYVGVNGTDVLKELAPLLQNDVYKLFGDVLAKSEGELPFSIILERGKGSSYETICDSFRLSHTYAYQIVQEFFDRISPFMDAIISIFTDRKEFVTRQEIEDIYDNDDYDQILIYWCDNSGYLKYIEDEGHYILGDEELSEGSSISVVTTSIEEEQANSDQGNDELGKLREVLDHYFGRGFRLNSPIELRKLRRAYLELFHEEFNEDDETIEYYLEQCGIQYDQMVYLPQNMLSGEIHEALFNRIVSTFEAGTKGIYYDSLYKSFSDHLLDSCIYNADMLREYLMYTNDGSYYVHKKFISQEENYSFNIIDEIREVLRNAGAPLSYDEIHSEINHLPLNKIRASLAINPEFISNGSGRYFHIDSISFFEDEISEIRLIIQRGIEVHRFISGTELLKALRIKCPDLFERNALFSDLGIRNAIANRMKDEFSFNSNIISGIDSNISMADVFAEFCRSKRSFTLSELNALKNEMGSTIYFDAVYDNSLRISEEEFVSKDQARFDVQSTDDAIERFCRGDYIPISAVTQFGSFPDAGFPWTHYLLEHYVADYSDRFYLLHGTYNANKCVGAIVRRGSGLDTFSDVLSQALADSSVELKKEDALQFFSDQGYIARRKYGEIEQVLLEAREIRNRKGSR